MKRWMIEQWKTAKGRMLTTPGLTMESSWSVDLDSGKVNREGVLMGKGKVIEWEVKVNIMTMLEKRKEVQNTIEEWVWNEFVQEMEFAEEAKALEVEVVRNEISKLKSMKTLVQKDGKYSLKMMN